MFYHSLNIYIGLGSRPFENQTYLSDFLMVQYEDVRYQLERTIQEPDKSGFGMVSVFWP
jgi:hypothetical protein